MLTLLLGFAATDFIITITLSAADATAHLVENPYTHDPARRSRRRRDAGPRSAAWAPVFLKGFKEAIGIAVVLVGVYLALNAVVIGVGLIARVAAQPHVLVDWKRLPLHPTRQRLEDGRRFAACFSPKLALGLSGF